MLGRLIHTLVLLFFLHQTTGFSAELNKTEQKISHSGTHRLGTRPDKLRNRVRVVGVDTASNDTLVGASCAWDAASSTCRASHAAAATLLSNSENAYMRLVSKYAGCLAAVDKESCGAMGDCLWNSNATQCEFVQFDMDHQDSPCIEASPVTIALTIDSAICAEIKNKDACNSDTRCTWGHTENACVMDFYGRLFGFTYDELLQVIEKKTSQLVEPFFERFHPLEHGFKWADVLKWQLPETECPEDVPPEACVIADALLEIETPVEFYCQVQYSRIFMFPKCLMNPHCRYSFDEMRCSAAEDTMRFAWGKGFEAMAALIESEGDKAFLEKQARCTVILDKERCTGECVWESDKTCALRDTVIFKSMSQLGNKGTDPVCILLKTLGDVECMDIDNYNTCISNRFCSWGNSKECMVAADYLIADAFDRDTTLREDYTAIEEHCARHNNNKACEDDLAGIESALF